MRLISLALCGALSGVVAASYALLLPLGEPSGIEIAGFCFGIKATTTSSCQAVDGAFYLFPGLVFGLLFGGLLRLTGRLTSPAAFAYAAAATLANGAAVFICVSLMHPLDDLLPFDNLIVDLAFAGVIAGAAGGSLLGVVHARLDRRIAATLPIAIAAGLGVLTPIVIMFDHLGVYAFYIIWQGGYAAAVAISLLRPADP